MPLAPPRRTTTTTRGDGCAHLSDSRELLGSDGSAVQLHFSAHHFLLLLIVSSFREGWPKCPNPNEGEI